jgi:sulfate-transporting ATPase
VDLDGILQYAVLGLGAGAVYALLGQGIIVIYRGSGIVNFAHGAMAMVGAFVFWELHELRGWSFWPALCFAVPLVALIGALVHLLVMRPMRRTAPLARLIATLGVLSVLTSAATLKWGTVSQVVDSDLPQDLWTFQHFGLDFAVGSDRVYLFGIACGLTALLFVVYRYTPFGIGVSAAAENERAASTLGWSPDVLAAVNWAVGAALAAVAGILVVPLTGLQVNQLTLLVIAALAAALAGGFSSFPVTLAGGLLIGIAQSEMARYGRDLFGDTGQQGIAASLPFAAIVVVLVVRGRGLPLRSHVLEKLPRLGTGVIRPAPLVVGAAVLAAGVVTVFDDDVNAAMLAMTLAGIIVLSLVVLTGYAGQVSLAQFALAGMGAFFTGKLVASEGWPFELAFFVGIAGAVVVGLLFALPALRTRGVNLAVVTLGLGFALQQVLFSNSEYTGGFEGTAVGETKVFGYSIDSVAHKERYLLFALFWLVVAALAVSNLRRGRAGRRLIAVRTNERAAASLGISVFGAKLYAFAVSAAVAGLGGILIGFENRTIVYTAYEPFSSISSVVQAVIGGVGFVTGTVFGSQFAPGAVTDLIVKELVDEPGQWLVLIAAVVLVVNLIAYPDGLAGVTARALRRFSRRRVSVPEPLDDVERERVRPATLEVRDLRVRLGGVDILGGVDLEVRPGEVVGLIGPNGAGKTMLIDAVTGFVRPFGGSVQLDGRAIDRWSAPRRARAGLTRSFQSLELFEDLTIRENLRAASDPRDRLAYFSDLVWPGRQPLQSTAVAAVREFGLEADLDRLPTELPYGRRRLVGIARAVATEPSVLLLDEPAAGLSEGESAHLATLVRRLADDWGIAVLLVEHDMSMVMGTCDRIVVIEFGHKIAEGTPNAVRSDPQVIAAYLGAPRDGASGAEPEALDAR